MIRASNRLSGICGLVLFLGTGFVQAQAGRSPLEISVFVSETSEATPLLYLQKQHPDLFKVNFHFLKQAEAKKGKSGRSGADAALMEQLKTIYVQFHAPDKFYDYTDCLQQDPSGAVCGSLLHIDFSKFDPKDSELSAAAKRSADEARRLGASEPTPAVFIDGKPYNHTLFFSELLPYLNALLPKEQRLAGIEALDSVSPIQLFAVGLARGIGARDTIWENQLSRGFPNLEIVPFNAESPEGKDFLKKTGTTALPAYIFDQSLKKRQPDIFDAMLGRNLLSEKNNYYVVNRNGATRILLDHPAQPKALTLFVMSQCPYGVQAEDAVLKTLKLKKLPEGFKLNVRYIVDRDPAKKGAWNSMHGPAEAAEDVRQAVIQKNFPGKFTAYLEARNRDVHSEKWEEAAKSSGIDPQSIKDRLQEGSALLEDDYKDSTDLGIAASPTFLWENRYLLASGSDLKQFIGVDPYNPTKSGDSAKSGNPPNAASCQ